MCLFSWFFVFSQDLESGSESRTDSMAVNQTQVNLSSESTDPSSTPGSNSGTKPKAMVSCAQSQTQQSLLPNMR